MNSLPRILGMGLLLVLAALVALLASSALREARRSSPAPRVAAPVSVDSAADPGRRPTQLAVASRRLALALAIGAFALGVMLIVSLSLRPPRTETREPFAATRSEINTLASLAKTSVAQGEELNRERDVRRRAEEDAQLKQQLLTQSLDEKIRLGRDLHDGIIQSLYAVGLTLETVRALVKSNPAEADRQLEHTRAGLNETIRDVRAYITGLAPRKPAARRLRECPECPSRGVTGGPLSPIRHHDRRRCGEPADAGAEPAGPADRPGSRE